MRTFDSRMSAPQQLAFFVVLCHFKVCFLTTRHCKNRVFQRFGVCAHQDTTLQKKATNSKLKIRKNRQNSPKNLCLSIWANLGFCTFAEMPILKCFLELFRFQRISSGTSKRGFLEIMLVFAFWVLVFFLGGGGGLEGFFSFGGGGVSCFGLGFGRFRVRWGPSVTVFSKVSKVSVCLLLNYFHSDFRVFSSSKFS